MIKEILAIPFVLMTDICASENVYHDVGEVGGKRIKLTTQEIEGIKEMHSNTVNTKFSIPEEPLRSSMKRKWDTPAKGSTYSYDPISDDEDEEEYTQSLKYYSMFDEQRRKLEKRTISLTERVIDECFPLPEYCNLFHEGKKRAAYRSRIVALAWEKKISS